MDKEKNLLKFACCLIHLSWKRDENKQNKNSLLSYDFFIPQQVHGACLNFEVCAS